MEKKEYAGLEMEVVRFDAEDVILTSGVSPCLQVGDNGETCSGVVCTLVEEL